MDKPRWSVTWVLAGCAATLAYSLSFWKGVLVGLPFAFAADAIEKWRSRRQNGGWA